MSNRADQRKFHYIYKITRNDGSGKYYIGMHSTDDLDDGYFGSGMLLWKSIDAYGKELHSKEILEFLPSRQELKSRERELVNEEIVSDPLCMNLQLGGGGGFSSQEHREKFIGSSRTACLRGTERASQISSRAAITTWNRHYDKMAKIATQNVAVACIKASSPEANEKRKATFAERGHMQGEKNSQFGTCWVTNGTPVKIKKEELDEYLTNGYRRGRK